MKTVLPWLPFITFVIVFFIWLLSVFTLLMLDGFHSAANKASASMRWTLHTLMPFSLVLGMFPLLPVMADGPVMTAVATPFLLWYSWRPGPAFWQLLLAVRVSFWCMLPVPLVFLSNFGTVISLYTPRSIRWSLSNRNANTSNIINFWATIIAFFFFIFFFYLIFFISLIYLHLL